MKKAAENASLKPEEAIDETEQITVETSSEVPVVNEAPAATDKVLSDRELRSAIRDFLFECEEDDGWFSASTMVNKLKEKFPSLDIKDYADLPLFAGKRKIWTTYFLALGFCENKQKGPSNYLLRLKPEERRKLAAERGTDSSESENAVAQSVADKSAAEKAPEISAAAEPAQNVSPAKKTSSGRRGRPRGKAGSKAENAEAKTAVAKPEAKSAAEKPESKDAVAKPEAKTDVAKPEAKTAVAKPEATAENNAAPGSKRKTGRKTASKAKAEVIEKNEEKIANDTSEKKAAVQNDAPKKAVSPRRGRPRKKAAPTESENA
jgi:hypothetical protein